MSDFQDKLKTYVDMLDDLTPKEKAERTSED